MEVGGDYRAEAAKRRLLEDEDDDDDAVDMLHDAANEACETGRLQEGDETALLSQPAPLPKFEEPLPRVMQHSASSSAPSRFAASSSSTARSSHGDGCAQAVSETEQTLAFVAEHRGGDDLEKAGAIEMQNLDAESEGNGALPSQGRGSSDRRCFICLMDGDKDNALKPCCSTCYACTHASCWREWRNNQRITTLRSRLLGQRTRTEHFLRCTICKSGTAVLNGEEDGLEWMHEFLCGGESATADRGRVNPDGLLRRHDSDEEDDITIEDLVDRRTCLALLVYLGIIILVLIIACALLVGRRFYAGDIVLCSIIALYELSVLQVVALAVARRRGMLVAAATPQEETRAEWNSREVVLNNVV